MILERSEGNVIRNPVAGQKPMRVSSGGRWRSLNLVVIGGKLDSVVVVECLSWSNDVELENGRETKS